MSRKKVKKGINPVVAVLGFLVCAGFAAKSVLGTLGSADKLLGGTSPTDDAMPEDLVSESGEQEKAAPKWTDLLAVHGSFNKASDVHLAFSVLVDAAIAAAPGGETGGAFGGAWIGDDPPMCKLSVVMVSSQSRRAVMNGRVVGIGDAIDKGQVTGIEAGRVTVQWNGRALTYDLDATAPREFRGEMARRQVEQVQEGDADLTPTTATTPSEDVTKKTPSTEKRAATTDTVNTPEKPSKKAKSSKLLKAEKQEPTK